MDILQRSNFTEINLNVQNYEIKSISFVEIRSRKGKKD